MKLLFDIQNTHFFNLNYELFAFKSFFEKKAYIS